MKVADEGAESSIMIPCAIETKRNVETVDES